ncbi:type VI secretion system protein TssA [Massilia sp. METH4]|uniref:type VI secretion system protein TssA n=1 Tax=Massilia sp. METH4 TaxID=3123041 RepID=UPI0030D0CED2
MLDIAQLLVPISVAQVCGEDLSFSSEVDTIANARKYDDPALDQGEWVEALKEADWPYVASHCEKLIRSRSKDLRLAVWLAEAHAKTRHFRGLGDGYALLAGLCERFWDGLYPVAEAGDHEQRIGNLFWLLKRSPQLVKEVPLTEDGSVCLADFDAARQRAANVQAPDEWGNRPAVAGPTVEELDARRRRNTSAFNAKLLADAQYCLESLQAFEQAVDRQLGGEGPSFTPAREALQHAIDFIGLLAPDQPAAPAEEAAGAQPAQKARADGSIASRQQAIDQLHRVAEYFRRTEPHSPVAYLADKAAAWAAMPLHQWLRAVVKDPGQMAQLDELLGTVGPEVDN